ncbi:hypothetical protein [Thermomonas paludicola]|uniref:hypothetical protein n=1 Tax=Thermomonas paludicola TaxID=2884874 RepID=UPI00211416EE|nr:hypothetical protein [Thermomonas paludicola]
MKVQMQGQRLRLRIDEQELARLQAGEVVENLTVLPGDVAPCLQVRALEALAPSFAVQGQGVCFGLPRHLIDEYVARLPCRDGLTLRFSTSGGEDLVLDFEVDVRDSVRSRGVIRRGATIS